MKVVDEALLNDLTRQACESERKRAHYNLHESLDEDIHRLCIGAEPGTYIRPHRHLDCDKWELFIILRGKVAILTYAEDGVVMRREELTAGGAPCVVEVAADVWHSFVSLQPGTVAMEVKRGPYQRPTDADFFSLAPAEGEPDAPFFEKWYHHAQPGDKLPPRQA